MSTQTLIKEYSLVQQMFLSFSVHAGHWKGGRQKFKRSTSLFLFSGRVQSIRGVGLLIKLRALKRLWSKDAIYSYVFVYTFTIFTTYFYYLPPFSFLFNSLTFTFPAYITKFHGNCFSVNILLFFSSRENMLLSIHIFLSFPPVN